MGRTSFCIEPRDRVRSIPVVGGTKNPKIEKILALTPDLVIANKEENRKEDVEALRSKDLRVWVNYPTKVSEVIPYMVQLAHAVGKTPEVEPFVREIETTLDELEGRDFKRKKTITLIWKDPWIAVGSMTYMDDVIRVAGGDNVATTYAGRYPEISEEEIIAFEPDILFLPSEPYSFGVKHQRYWREKLPNKEVVLISGEDLSWFGVRTSRGLQTIRRIISREASE